MINIYDAITKLNKAERVAIIMTLVKEHVDFMQTSPSAKASSPSYHVGFFSGMNQVAIQFGCVDMVDTLNITRDEAIKELYDENSK